MKVVIVGAGASGLLHALAFRAAGVAVEAVFDPDRARAKALAEMVGARLCDDYASVDAELAAVCSPPQLHAEQALRLARGRTVFVEKPVATTLRDLDRLAALPNCVPIVQWRAGRALRALQRAVAHGMLGAAPTIACDLAWGRDNAYFETRRDWRCSAILSIGIHALDALVWALGRDIERTAGLVTERAAAVLLGFAGGARATLRISLEGGANTTRMTFCGDGRSAYLHGPEADPTGGALSWSASDAERLRALERATPGATGSPLLVPYLGAAVAALRAGERPGESTRLLAIVDTQSAHRAAITLASDGEAALEQLADVPANTRMRVGRELEELGAERAVR